MSLPRSLALLNTTHCPASAPALGTSSSITTRPDARASEPLAPLHLPCRARAHTHTVTQPCQRSSAGQKSATPGTKRPDPAPAHIIITTTTTKTTAATATTTTTHIARRVHRDEPWRRDTTYQRGEEFRQLRPRIPAAAC